MAVGWNSVNLAAEVSQVVSQCFESWFW